LRNEAHCDQLYHDNNCHHNNIRPDIFDVDIFFDAYFDLCSELGNVRAHNVHFRDHGLVDGFLYQFFYIVNFYLFFSSINDRLNRTVDNFQLLSGGESVTDFLHRLFIVKRRVRLARN
jgi:hypothetical protein